MTHTEILRRIAEKGTLIGQCTAIWYQNKKRDKNGKIYVLECAEMCEVEWIKQLWGTELVAAIRRYAKNYRGPRRPNNSQSYVLGKTLRDIRYKSGFKQLSLANATGISQSFLSKIESRNIFIPTEIAEKIASTLNVASKEFVKSI